MNQRIGICFHGTRILPISIALEGFFLMNTTMQCVCNGLLNSSFLLCARGFISVHSIELLELKLAKCRIDRIWTELNICWTGLF